MIQVFDSMSWIWLLFISYCSGFSRFNLS